MTRQLELTLAHRLRISMDMAGLDRNDMAERLHRNVDMVSRYLNGQAIPDYTVLYVWAAVTDVKLSELLPDHPDSTLPWPDNKPFSGAAGAAATPIPDDDDTPPPRPARPPVKATKPGRKPRSSTNHSYPHYIPFYFRVPRSVRRPGPAHPPGRR